jgi:hypothetical protein
LLGEGMNVTEIILLILGLLVFILSFVLPAKKKGNAQEPQRLKEEQIKELISREVEDAKRQITDIVDETVTYSMEKTERHLSMFRVMTKDSPNWSRCLDGINRRFFASRLCVNLPINMAFCSFPVDFCPTFPHTPPLCKHYNTLLWEFQ